MAPDEPPVAAGPPVTFALVHASEPGNAGAAARTLAAFGFDDLALIAPAHRPDAQDQALARRGVGTLTRAVVIAQDEASAWIARFPEVWGTTARPGRARKLERPDALVAGYLDRGPGPLLVLFGSERDGLGRDWLDRCHRLARIPSPGGPLNLAHAVTVMAYELRRQAEARAARAHDGAGGGLEATPAQRREILARSAVVLRALAYPSRSLKRHPPEAYLEPLRSGPLSFRQAQWMLGLLARLEERLGPEAARTSRR